MCRFLALLAWVSPCAALAAPDDAPAIVDDSHVTIQGVTYEIYPPDKLAALGVRVVNIPREDNAAFVYFDALNAMTPATEGVADALRNAARGEWPDGELGEKLSECIARNAAALEIVRAGSKMEQYYLPLFRGESDSLYACLLPSLGNERQLAQMLAADAHRRAANGDYAGALDNLLSMQRMGHQLGHGTTMIEGLVGMSVGALASEQLTTVAEAYEIEPDLLRDTVAEMDALAANMPTFDDLVRAEQAISANFVDDVMNDPRHLDIFTNYSGNADLSNASPDNGWIKLFAAVRRVYLPDRAMKRNLQKYYDKVREGTRPREDGTPGTIIEEDKLLELIPEWDVVTTAMIPSLSHAYESSLRYQSNYTRSMLRIAAQAYRVDHGRLPPSLAALSPQYVGAVPPDPMTGYDFEYRPDASADGIPSGLEPVTNENAEALRMKRRTPAILTPRASKWRRFVIAFGDRHDFTESQRHSADAILRDVESRAAAFERSRGTRIKQLIEDGDTEAAKKQTGPLDKLFDELKSRLDRLPTADQRAKRRDDDRATE